MQISPKFNFSTLLGSCFVARVLYCCCVILQVKDSSIRRDSGTVNHKSLFRSKETHPSCLTYDYYCHTP